MHGFAFALGALQEGAARVRDRPRGDTAEHAGCRRVKCWFQEVSKAKLQLSIEHKLSFLSLRLHISPQSTQHVDEGVYNFCNQSLS